MIMNMNTRNLRRGFTLIEILVVIAIIGILSAVLYANFGDARVEAKNKAVQSELKETQLALELYKSQNGQYPPAVVGGGGCNAGSNFTVDKAHSAACGATPIISGLVPEFVAELPSHTKSANSNCDIVYTVDKANHSWYKLTAEHCHGGATSAAGGVQPDDKFARCLSVTACSTQCTVTYKATSDFYESYAVYSAGGECQL